MLLNKDQILKADDRAIEVVPVPEWGGDVAVRGMIGRDRDEYEASMATMRNGRLVPDTENSLAKLVARCIVDEAGEPMFTQHDVHALGEKSSAALTRVGKVAAALSGLDDAEAAVLEKVFGPGPSDSSTSSSPSPSAAAPSKNSSRGSPRGS
jgi:hypothetical protein